MNRDCSRLVEDLSVDQHLAGVVCDACGGRGWRPGKKEWPDRCNVCDGMGAISLWKLGRYIGECPSTLRRLERGEMSASSRGSAVASRILAKLTELLPNGRPRRIEHVGVSRKSSAS